MKWRTSEILILALLTVAVVGVYLVLFRMVANRERPPAPPGSAEVLAPTDGLVAGVGSTLDVQARAAGSDVCRLEFWTDDAPLFVSSRSVPAGSDAWTISGRWTVGWPGLHRLYVRGFSLGGIVTSNPITVAAVPAGEMVFASNRDGRYAIYRSALAGDGLERVYGGQGDSREPAVSPTGRLAMTQILAGQPRGLWQLDLTARTPRLLLEDAANLSQAAWSPAGSAIAFVSNRSGRDQIWLADADGSNARRLTDEPTLAAQPAWSPDGTRLAYTARSGDNWDIYRLPIAGGKPARLTRAAGVDWQPAWSPAAELIAFVSNREGTYQIYVMDAEGNAQRPLTDLAGGAEQPRWSPDGNWIVFVGHTGRGDGFNARELYVMRADGRDLIRLTDNATDETEPVWLLPADAGPIVAPAAASFAAAYFANMTLTGAPALTRDEARPDFDWGAGGPGGGIPADHFSARWSGAWTVDAAGDYLFELRADDGARLFVDGVLALDLWGQRGGGEAALPLHLSVGSHALKLEYYENEGPASISLRWSRVK